MFTLIFLLFSLFIVSIQTTEESEISNCQWTSELIKDYPEVYYINLNSSSMRNNQILKHLNSIHSPYNHRVPALTFETLYVPDLVKYNWINFNPMSFLDVDIPHRTNSFFWRHHSNATHVITALEGRPNKNYLNEILCTTSHLEAIRKAIFENTTDSKYALIMEDDVWIPFNVNFTGLVESAPKDFAFLQLVNSDHDTSIQSWQRYMSGNILWQRKWPDTKANFWSTCAYLINREILRPIISKIMWYSEWTGRIHLKILPALRNPCKPPLSECCIWNERKKKYDFVNELPCVFAPKGLQADSFIYALGPTYVSTIPLISNAQTAMKSTIHQNHVSELHSSAFQKHREYMNKFISKDVNLPSFVQNACQKPLQIALN